MGGLAEPVQYALAARNCIEPFLPCDVTAYDSALPLLEADFVWECILAIVKEPMPTSIIVRHITAASSDAASAAAPGERPLQFYGRVCVSACQEMDGVSTPEVWKNLNSQGVCRFVGFLTVIAQPAQTRRR